MVLIASVLGTVLLQLIQRFQPSEEYLFCSNQLSENATGVLIFNRTDFSNMKQSSSEGVTAASQDILYNVN